MIDDKPIKRNPFSNKLLKNRNYLKMHLFSFPCNEGEEEGRKVRTKNCTCLELIRK